jgi:hypothetical protein
MGPSGQALLMMTESTTGQVVQLELSITTVDESTAEWTREGQTAEDTSVTRVVGAA